MDTMLEVLKWVILVLLAGFIGQFGRTMSHHLMDHFRKKREKKELTRAKNKSDEKREVALPSKEEEEKRQLKEKKKLLKAQLKVKKKSEKSQGEK